MQEFPISKNCLVENVEIGSNRIWEGLDTHGGQNIKFINNIIKDVKVPIAAVPSEVNGEDTYAPQDILIQGNLIENTGEMGVDEVNKGIILSGAKYSSINLTGEPVEYTTGGKIKDNQIKGYGEYSGSPSTGAISIQATKGAVVSGNVISRSYISGITVYMQNIGFTIEKNYIDGFLESKSKFPACITVKDKWNEGEINNNECFTIAYPKYLPVDLEELQRININHNFSSVRGVYVGTLNNVDVTAIGNRFGKGIGQAYRYMYLKAGKGESAVYSTKK
ncbi:hypothetical protein IIY_01815 [Bacillus cereus VD140]|nr:hypothetical protein IIY_01815 [Bacillus cereus VD140]